MQLPLGFGDLDFGDWVRGVLAAFIGGGASAFASGVANILNHPTKGVWNTEFWSEVGTTFIVAGLIALMAFLRTKPVPDVKHVVDTTKTVDVPGHLPATITTHEESSIQKK